MKNSRKTFALAAIVVLSLALAAPAAFAQSSVDGYSLQGPATLDQTLEEPGSGPIQNDNDVAGDAPDVADDQVDQVQEVGNGNDARATLPFTGLDLSLLALAGGLLLVLGVGMRQLTRAPDNA